MIADRKDFTEGLAKKHSEKQSAMLPMAKLIQAAAVVSDQLQRTPEWERYCTYLQGLAEQFKARKVQALQKLGDPRIVDDQQIRKLRQDIFIADVSIDTLKFAVELPAYILKGNEEADAFVKAYEKKNETTGNA